MTIDSEKLKKWIKKNTLKCIDEGEDDWDLSVVNVKLLRKYIKELEAKAKKEQADE